MKISSRTACLLLVGFVMGVPGIALLFNSNFPVLVFAGEDSVGTWMSGALLIFSASRCLFIGMNERWYPWLLLASFFLLLALDERFMFHELVKERILFSHNHTSRPVYELPVIIGAGLGVWAALLLWRHTLLPSRILILGAAALGTTSVVIDVLAAGVLWEECCKILAEMLAACALLVRTPLVHERGV
jgi:hypothetical protein